MQVPVTSAVTDQDGQRRAQRPQGDQRPTPGGVRQRDRHEHARLTEAIDQAPDGRRAHGAAERERAATTPARP